MSLGEKIKNARKNKKMSQDVLAELLNINRVSVSNWEKDKNSPTHSNIIKMSEILGVDFLMPTHQLNKFIPLIGLASCGTPQEYDLNGYDAVPIDTKMYSDGMYAVQAEGDSMSPKITHGNILYCSPSVQIENGSLVHYKFKDESGIKRYKINGLGTIVSLVPINSDYDIVTIDEFEQGMLTMVKVTAIIDTDL